jgi:hypothetical protein
VASAACSGLVLDAFALREGDELFEEPDGRLVYNEVEDAAAFL